MDDLRAYLADVHRRVLPETGGEVASYIPALAEADPEPFGIAIATVDGQLHEAGDARTEFSLQSVSKPFTYALALSEVGFDAVDAAIDVEPSGEAYNRISLQDETGRPDNALINAGAIAATSLLPHKGRMSRLLRFYSSLAGRALHADASIAMEEVENGHRNLAMAHLMHSFDILGDDPVEATRDYCAACATMVTTADLAWMAAALANGGTQPATGQQLLEPLVVQRVLSVMTMSGMYDEAGWWMVRVGLPGKSGVGGGLIAVAPGQLGLAVFSPRLNEHGSSVRGVATCEIVSRDLDLHVMGPRR
ncbi:hypothetical protein GCM10027030_32210 [Luteococcus sediminum]|uniref:glutaminase A n=1 Tax=Luteococcus sp. TaxID=1969402 RepID=UPI0037353B6B